jgi:anti-anti-sigma factor
MMSERQTRLDGAPVEPAVSWQAPRNQTPRIVYAINCGRVVAQGVLDFGFAEQLTDILAAALAGRPPLVSLDLTDVWLIDAGTVRVLLAFQAQAAAAGCAFRITGAHGIVQRVLEITGVLPGSGSGR